MAAESERFSPRPTVEDPDACITPNLAEDDRGLYRVDSDGNKWRRPEWYEGVMVYDNGTMARERQFHRMLQQHGLDPLSVIESQPIGRHKSKYEKR